MSANENKRHPQRHKRRSTITKTSRGPANGPRGGDNFLPCETVHFLLDKKNSLMVKVTRSIPRRFFTQTSPSQKFKCKFPFLSRNSMKAVVMPAINFSGPSPPDCSLLFSMHTHKKREPHSSFLDGTPPPTQQRDSNEKFLFQTTPDLGAESGPHPSFIFCHFFFAARRIWW
jgi:hypothetical protein